MLELIKTLSKALNEAYTPRNILNCLENFFEENFRASEVVLYIFDESTGTLRDFAKNWLILENKKDDIYGIWKEISDSGNFTTRNDVIFYPLKKFSKILGFLKIERAQSEILEFLSITDNLISLKIQNIILSDKMRKNIEFHSSMKNIAKIIETQYEMNYIIPIIGEMIDKFVAEHLVYMFLATDETDDMQLIWPNSCNDEKILELIKVVNADSEFFTTNDKKIGVFPMAAEGKLIGAIVTKSMDTPLHEKEIEYIEQLANQAATTINRANVYAEILKHATLDALTGFYNRRQLEERVKQEVSAAHRNNRSLCAVMTDIDFFKSFNDKYGHSVGDYVLKTVSQAIKNQLRDYDIAGRYGGEEFLILLPYTGLKEAEHVAQRLRSAVEITKLDISKINPEIQEHNIGGTISLGVCELQPEDSGENLINKADKALYEAKNSGRNKVVIYE